MKFKIHAITLAAAILLNQNHAMEPQLNFFEDDFALDRISLLSEELPEVVVQTNPRLLDIQTIYRCVLCKDFPYETDNELVIESHLRSFHKIRKKVTRQNVRDSSKDLFTSFKQLESENSKKMFSDLTCLKCFDSFKHFKELQLHLRTVHSLSPTEKRKLTTRYNKLNATQSTI